VIEICCWDGSVLQRLTPLSQEQCQLFIFLSHFVAEFRLPRLRPVFTGITEPLGLSVGSVPPPGLLASSVER